MEMINTYEWDNFEVDEAFAKLAAREFADPKNGMPEWIKNANDAYIREDNQGTRLLSIYASNSKEDGLTSVVA